MQREEKGVRRLVQRRGAKVGGKGEKGKKGCEGW